MATVEELTAARDKLQSIIDAGADEVQVKGDRASYDFDKIEKRIAQLNREIADADNTTRPSRFLPVRW